MSLSADASNLRKMGRALRQSDAAMYREVQAALRAVGARVAAKAAANAHWSKRIPASGRVSAYGLNAVTVKFSAPNAGPIENHGIGHVRHPVFGDRTNWTDKNSPPAFLLPAATEGLMGSAQELADALTVRVEKTIHGQTGFF